MHTAFKGKENLPWPKQDIKERAENGKCEIFCDGVIFTAAGLSMNACIYAVNGLMSRECFSTSLYTLYTSGFLLNLSRWAWCEL